VTQDFTVMVMFQSKYLNELKVLKKSIEYGVANLASLINQIYILSKCLNDHQHSVFELQQ